MTLPTTSQTPRRRLHRVWQLLPAQAQKPLRSLLSATGLLPRLQRLVTPGASDKHGFITLTPETPGALTSSLAHIAQHGPSGDYYEFGLFRGYTFWHAQQTASELGLDQMRFFGFDSFAGLPLPNGIDAETGEFNAGDYACSEAEVRALLSSRGCDWTKSFLTKGYYDQSLSAELKHRLNPGMVAVALIDCDLYHSTVPVLHFLADRLQDGAILLFDDWNCFGKSDQHGQRRAFHEFLAANPGWAITPFLSFGWHGQAFVVRRRMAATQASLEQTA